MFLKIKIGHFFYLTIDKQCTNLFRVQLERAHLIWKLHSISKYILIGDMFIYAYIHILKRSFSWIIKCFYYSYANTPMIFDDSKQLFFAKIVYDSESSTIQTFNNGKVILNGLQLFDIKALYGLCTSARSMKKSPLMFEYWQQ